MFTFTKETRELLDKDLDVYDKARIRRERVRDFIDDEGGNRELTNTLLARAAGFDMSDAGSKEYARGQAFITSMKKAGYLQAEKIRVGNKLETAFTYIENPVKPPRKVRKNKVVKKVKKTKIPVTTDTSEDGRLIEEYMKATAVELKDVTIDFAHGNSRTVLTITKIDSRDLVSKIEKLMEVL